MDITEYLIDWIMYKSALDSGSINVIFCYLSALIYYFFWV